jgi:hypothetical protein
VINADAWPSEYVACYNHYNKSSHVRLVRPTSQSEKCEVQRMEMLAIYFALADNLRDILTTPKPRKNEY